MQTVLYAPSAGAASGLRNGGPSARGKAKQASRVSAPQVDTGAGSAWQREQHEQKQGGWRDLRPFVLCWSQDSSPRGAERPQKWRRPAYRPQPSPPTLHASGTSRISPRVWTEKAGLEVASSRRSLEAMPSTSQSPTWRPPPTPRRACGACTPTWEGSQHSLLLCPLQHPGLFPASSLFPSVCLSV